jgi:hypothetical protein
MVGPYSWFILNAGFMVQFSTYPYFRSVEEFYFYEIFSTSIKLLSSLSSLIQ